MRSILICLLLIAAPAWSINVLKGSRPSLAHQNRQADIQGLVRFTESNVTGYKKRKELVKLPRGRGLRVSPDLPRAYRWCLPRTKYFLQSLGTAYEKTFSRELQINSAMRTREYQQNLQRTNKNAARGETKATRSPHLTGAAIDITKRGMTASQIRWVRKYLIRLEKSGHIDATEEFGQAVFHIMVMQWPDPNY